jgi:hypothetical protein
MGCFLMFVPSLSWSIDRFCTLMASKKQFFLHLDNRATDLVAAILLQPGRVYHEPVCKDNIPYPRDAKQQKKRKTHRALPSFLLFCVPSLSWQTITSAFPQSEEKITTHTRRAFSHSYRGPQRIQTVQCWSGYDPSPPGMPA